MKKNYLILFALIIIIGVSCKKGNNKNDSTNTSKSLSGVVQKGPFLNGSSITLNELNQNYSQTGRTFSTQVINNSGLFQFNGLALSSSYVSIRADGYYFNEVCGSNSKAPLTLYAIADINSALHVNILTDLEYQRTQYLLASGQSIDSAKKHAQAEVLNIFNISSSGIQNSEYLDISNSGNGNAILLAISSILQGFRTESELSGLLSSISNDISSDGVLNDTSIKSSIIDHAILLDTISIRNNITNYYLNLGINPSISHFEYYIQHFINNTNFQATNSVITYPSTGIYGDNILLKNQLNYSGENFSLKANLKRCSQLKIKIQLISGSPWFYAVGSGENWIISEYDEINNVQFFTIIDPEQPSDLNINIPDPGVYLISYFEKNLTVPTFSKTITMN